MPDEVDTAAIFDALDAIEALTDLARLVDQSRFRDKTGQRCMEP